MSNIKINGYCDPAFNKVKDTFLTNFNKKKESGASVSVVLKGKPVVDIWAGSSDAIGKRDWQEDTIANIYSATKAMTAVCALRLVEQGQLDIEKPVSTYWPEFTGEKKETITVRMLMNHQAGMVGIKKRLHYRSIYEWDYMASELAGQAPWWTPGHGHGYHAVTYGWLLGEVIRRITGKTVGEFLKEEIAEPFDIDIRLGLDDSEFKRTAFMKPKLLPSIHKDVLKFLWPAIKNPRGAASSAFTNPVSVALGVNTKSWKRAEIPSANGHSNGRGLAKFYGILANGGTDGEKTLLTEETIAMLSNEESFGLDKVLNVSTRFSLGFMLSQNTKTGAFGPNLKSFGHPGAGGALGFADPDAKIGFGYVMNKMDTYILVDPRAKRMIDAVYDCL